MKIVVIDGQGGRMGAELVRSAVKTFPQADILAVGTNSLATAAMLKAGAKEAATGENAAVVAARTADIIVGPLGMVIADALLGEVTPLMATAIAQSPAARVMIPMNKCDNLVAGVEAQSMSELIGDAMKKIQRAIQERCIQ